GLPDGNHIDNANMGTPPDGMRPTMQMYLQHQPGTSYPDEDPFAPTNVGDEADTVYHEYTHGLSNRLVVDVQGGSTLGGVQAGSMGEAWSDWYAMDYLVAHGFQKDKPGVADVVLFQYDGEGVYYDRTEPIDCAVKQPSRRCTGGSTGHRAGYTYADYGKVVGAPEVHGDGEIWAQTLWQLRHALGSKATESLVTRAMELAPYDPSFLDMRNAILVADTNVYGGDHHAKIWKTFAKRGMGFYAGSLGGEDSQPGASFAVPPTSRTRGYVTGTVTDSQTHDPLSGVPVTLAFQGRGEANPTAITDAHGHYRLGPVPAGRYRKLTVSGGGFQPVTRAVTVTGGDTTVGFRLVRDYAASSGGASVTEATGTDYTAYGCGPDLAIDLSQATGWVTNAGVTDAETKTVVPKHFTVDLGRQIEVNSLGVDPTSACGVGGSASTAGYTIETSPDNVTFTPAASGTFTVADQGRLNSVTPTGATSHVRYVRFTITSNQTPDPATNCPGGGYGGCSYVSMSELEVFGTPTP
ncbi:MAG: M36 family metallopeptidase, partial [Nocardioides sp.]